MRPDILRGGHRNPYQLENTIKTGGTVFCIYHLGEIVNQGAVLACIFFCLIRSVTYLKS